MSHERKVRDYYNSAVHCFEAILGDYWHHGDPEAEARGLPLPQACEALHEKLVSLSKLRAGEWALDFGSGIGGPTGSMARLSKAHFVGVCNNEPLSQRARDRAAQAGLSNQTIFATMGDMDYSHLPFPDAAFDAVFFYESVCHLTDKAAFFKEAFRVLKPERRLVGIDWLQRPFGDYQTEEQILSVMGPVNEVIFLPWHGTVDGYRAMMEEAGFKVVVARDMFEGVKCWGSTPQEHREQLQSYAGPEFEQFRKGKEVLDAAREAGVFTVGMFAAEKSAHS
jgi:tocopherol O-methyltransferase